jgi:hypothetical protein
MDGGGDDDQIAKTTTDCVVSLPHRRAAAQETQHHLRLALAFEHLARKRLGEVVNEDLVPAPCGEMERQRVRVLRTTSTLPQTRGLE